MRMLAPTLLVTILLIAFNVSRASDFSRPGESVGTWQDPALTPHPRIWMTPKRLADLRARKPSFGEGTIADAMTYLVHRNAAAGKKAVAWARKRAKKMVSDYTKFSSSGTGMNKSSWDLITMSIVYDYCHDLLTDEDKEQIVKYVNACHDGMKDNYIDKMDNYLVCPMMTGIAALATAENNPRAKEILDHHLKVRWINTVKPLLKEFGNGGGWWEGEGYGYGYSNQLILFCEAVHTATGRNLFAEAEEFFFDRLRYFTLGTYPLGRNGRRLLFICGDQALDKNYDVGYWPRAVLANHYRKTALGSGALDMIRRGYAHQFGDHRWVTAFNSLPTKGAAFQSLPLDHFAPGSGRVLAKSDWSNDAATVTFMVDDHVSWHDHMDSGHFNIYRHDLLTAQSGFYRNGTGHFRAYYKRSSAKNCVSVYMPGEKSWARYGDHNDGGQAHSGKWGPPWPKWKANRQKHEMGDMVAYGASKEFVYACGDITAAYSSKKMSRYLRHFLFIRPDTIVVYDSVTATQGSYRKTWHLQLFEKPEIAQQGESTLARADNGAGRLYCLSMLPKNLTTKVSTGFETEGVRHSVSSKGLNPRHRYDVVAPTGQSTSVFLNVLKATSSSDSTPPRCTVSEKSGRLTLAIAGRGTVTIPKSGALGWSLEAGSRAYDLPTQIELNSSKMASRKPATRKKRSSRSIKQAAVASEKPRVSSERVSAIRSQLKQWVIDGVESGRQKTVYVKVAGTLSRAKLVQAGDTGMVVQAYGNQFPVRWDQLEPKRLFTLAKKYAPEGNGEISNTLREFQSSFDPAVIVPTNRSSKPMPVHHKEKTRKQTSKSAPTRQAYPLTARNTSDGAASLKGPFLQYPKDPSSRSIAIVWETKKASAGFVKYRVSGGNWKTVQSKAAATRHEVMLEDLTPGTLHEYRIGGGSTGKGTFILPTKGQEKFRFVVVGDPRAYDKATQALIGQVIQDRPDLLLATGDYVGKAGDPVRANWTEYFDSNKDLINNVPFFPSVGDHDDTDGGVEYRQNFTLPGEEMYYSFDWGRCHFISLWVSWPEKWKSDSAQYKWLLNDLKKAKGKYDFIIAFYHLPMATVGNYGDSPGNWKRARNVLLPLFKQYGVDASFGGHDHNYQHWNIEGHTFVLTGGFNQNNLYDIREDLKKKEMEAGRVKNAIKASHYVRVDVDGKTANFTIQGLQGKVIDQFSIKSKRKR